MAGAAPSPKPRVLVIRGGAIGDFILTLPAIRLLREGIPGAHLEILGYPGIASLAVEAGLADAVRNLEHRTMAPLFAPGAPIDEELTGYLLGFNLIVSYLYDPDGFFRGNMQRLGVKTLVEASHRVSEGEGHAAAQLARPLEKLALFLDDPAPRLKLKAAVLDASRPIVAIHPGSGSEKKVWPVEQWIRAGRELAAAHPHIRLALITGEAEQDRGVTQRLVAGWAGLDFLHWDHLALPELARHLASCSAFLGHDSGISHLAAACGVPCLLLFGPTDPSLWAPQNPGVTVRRAPDGVLSALAWDDIWPALCSFVEEKIVQPRP